MTEPYTDWIIEQEEVSMDEFSILKEILKKKICRTQTADVMLRGGRRNLLFTGPKKDLCY